MVRAICIAWLAVLSGCSTPARNATCVAGQSIGCACTSGSRGAQVCQSDGTYASCVCDSGLDGAIADSARAPVGDSGTTVDAEVGHGYLGDTCDPTSGVNECGYTAPGTCFTEHTPNFKVDMFRRCTILNCDKHQAECTGLDGICGSFAPGQIQICVPAHRW